METKIILSEYVTRYLKLGWSIFPVGKDKKPLSSWKRCQTVRNTLIELEQQYRQTGFSNLGVATGPLSGIVVLDLDAKHGWTSKRLRELGYELPVTATAKTGNLGNHFFFRYPDINIPNSQGQLSFGPGVDIRGAGGLVVLPPSITAYKDTDGKDAGGEYQWIVPPEDGIADMPEWLLAEIKGSGNTKKKNDWRKLMDQDSVEGMRNGTATIIAGGLLHTTKQGSWKTYAWPRLQKWNQDHCKPPLPETELRTTFDSIARSELQKLSDPDSLGVKDTKTTQIVNLVVGNPAMELFHDEYGFAYARAAVNERNENIACNSRKFKLWLTGMYYDKYGEGPQPSAISAALATIESAAIFKGKERKLHNRIARDGDVILYDLADDKNRAVRITPQGWDITTAPTILFRHEAHQLGQVEPVLGGDARTLFRFVNVTDPDQQLLVLVYLVACMIPGFPHPLLYLYGEQGSSKSSFSKILRMLIDPSKEAVLGLPRDVKELALQLSRHHLIFYENVSRISQAVSDMLCIAVTGGSISKRMLYTDADDFFVTIQTNVGINAINISATQPDLLERTILLGFERITETARKDEASLYKEFEIERPKILGALFTAAAKALSIQPGIVLNSLPRMADFARWGSAIAKGLGFTKEDFLRVYNAKIREQSDEALEASTEGTALMRFADSLTEIEWHGEPTRLLAELKRIVNNNDTEFSYGEELPKKASQLMRKLNVLKPNLRTAGYDFCSKKVNGRRHVFIKKIGAKAVQSVQGVPLAQKNSGAVDVTKDGKGQDAPLISPNSDIDLGHKDDKDGADDDIKAEEIPF